jgi:hypothetical protein
MLSAAVAPSVQQTQRITTCDCDNSPQQSFQYPQSGDTGVVSLDLAVEGLRCWVFTADGCDWPGYNSSCIELGSCDQAPTWNVTPGFALGTVVFQSLTPVVPGVEPNKACADWNKGKGLLELYPCYGTENS